MNQSKKIGPADDGFTLDDYILYNLNRASAVYTDEMSAALKSHGLNTVKWRILMLLSDESPSSVSDLARRSVTKMPTLTRMLIRMEEEGLIVRTVLEDDRRFVEVTMTTKAARTLRTVQSVGQRVFERAFEGLRAREISVAMNVLKRVRENLLRSPYATLQEKPRKRA
jgi:DNA-binding MarR family transcriptional regulator